MAARFSQNTRVLQWLDRWVGGPLCSLLAVFLRPGACGDRIELPDFDRVVFVKLAEQGSTVLAYDAVRRAVKRVGPAHVYFVVFEENRAILDLLGLIPPENVLALRTRTPWSLAISVVAALGRLRRNRVDACVDLEFLSNISALFAFFTGARWRAGLAAGGKRRFDRSALFTHRLNYNPHLHTSRVFSGLIAALQTSAENLPAIGVAEVDVEPPALLPTSDRVRRDVQDKLAAVGVPAGVPMILLNANAGDLLPLRKWPAENYIELARRLLRQHPEAWIILTGAEPEAKAVAALARVIASPRCVSLAGQTTLRELIALYDLAALLVTNDSGPAHFAALTKMPVVVLFGPESPVRFAAENLRTHVFWAGLPCSPCINAYNERQTSCRNNLCLQSIRVDHVFLRVGQLLRERKTVSV